MEFQLQITHDRKLARRAVRQFMFNDMNGSMLAILAFFGMLLLFDLFFCLWNLYTLVLAVAYLTLIATIFFIYILRLCQVNGFFDKAKSYTVEYSISDFGIEAKSDLGSASLKWEAFERVLKFSDVWLLVYSKSAYMLFPKANLSVDLQEFIESKILKN